jgi:hypothetical protein
MARFERYTSLLTDASTAQNELVMTGNVDGILNYLDKEVQLELKRIEALEKQWEIEKKRKDLRESMIESSKELNKQFLDSESDPVIKRLTELEVARQLGQMDNETYNRAQQAAVAGTGTQMSTSLAANINAGSQEAYKFMVGAQDRNTKMQMQKMQEQTMLLKKSSEALEKAVDLLDEIADNPIGTA